MAVLSIALSQVDGFPEEPKAVLFNVESSFKASAMTYSRPTSQVDAVVDMEVDMSQQVVCIALYLQRCNGYIECRKRNGKKSTRWRISER